MFQKTILCSFIAGILLPNFVSAISLSQALDQGTIALNITANPKKAGHTGPCVQFNLKNLSTQNASIEIPCGLSLHNLRLPAQDLIVLEPMLVKLLPHQQKEIVLNAVCTEKQQSSPSATDTFSLGPLPSPALAGLSQKLYQLKCFDHTAQQAVWSVTDKSPLSDILDTHSDTLVENVLITYLAEQLKQPKPMRTKSSAFTPRVIRYPLEADSKFEVQITRPVTIGFCLTDSNMQVIETIIPDQYEGRKGRARFSYILRLSRPQGVYYICQRTDGVLTRVQSIQVGPDRT
jgi:hypothetical protein